ncbi:uncharacterized protein C8R40DRAFT_1088515 [Lentinula edodes]|uniref:uncharacterized protein n=1 Tax=Lentinula edodes TaxID=5353 RepID=UPI001E8DE00F|nr:uncharacterized protein C8R40DRAFT_1088515 [Lentinula edodes]KAH7879027.1 hypothetical protein C8R40DRAFT_1088515 [Lentinula edodes]
MAVLSLPLSFNNSFWTQDYRKGVEVLFQKLEQGTVENDEVIAFIQARAEAESQLAEALHKTALTGTTGAGFAADDGASLLMAFRGLQIESTAQAKLHQNMAKELSSLVADPFAEWAKGYKDRIVQSKGVVLNQWLYNYEHHIGDVAKLKHQYLAKVRKADEAEDDAKFAPNSGGNDHYTTSPRLRPIDARSPPQRTSSVSERIAARLKDIQKKSSSAFSTKPETASLLSSESDAPDETPKVDKGKGKAVIFEASPMQLNSPLPMSPPLPPRVDASPVPPMPAEPVLLAGLSLPPAAISQLLTRAASELNLRPVRFPLLGEYKDCFTGEEFVAWLKDNVQGLGGSLDRAEQAAKDLTERDGLLRRIGELGNDFEHSEEAFYQFRPKAFELPDKSTDTTSPIKLQPDELLKRTNTIFNAVSKALQTNQSSEPTHMKARHEAEDADKAYRVAVRQLDRQRLGLEERLEDTLKTLQRWEFERLRAVKTVLLQYQGTLANLPKSLEPVIERQGLLIAAFQPENDLNALIERYRTGPFRPDAQVYESVAHDESDVVFGIDLRKWSEGGWSMLMSPNEEHKETIPPVVEALLNAITAAYDKLPNDAEKRKSWIYEVPLPAVHHLREVLNAVPPDQPIRPEIFEPFDAPVIAATLKLWLLELDPPLGLYEFWDDYRKLYPTMGATLVVKPEGEDTKEEKIKELGTMLQRLPRVHLYVLDAIVSHLKKLVENTKVEESDEVYITKLALSIGRTVVRPKFETELTIQDRHPTLLFLDLMKDYEAILPPTIARKKRESERKIPLRKRTAPMDMRIHRSRLSTGIDAKQLLAAQHAAQGRTKSPPPVPPMPSMTSIPAPPPILSPQPMPPPPPLPQAVSPPAPAPPPAAESLEDLAPPTIPPPPPLTSTPAIDDVPPRPSFKTPPPEDEDLPPRPAFKEPSPEPEELETPPRPHFAEPSAEPTPDAPPIPSPPAVSPPTPQPVRATEVKRSSRITSRSPSPADQSLSSVKSTISRSSSGGVRGPRMTRGPRAPGGPNRNSIGSGAGSPPSGVSPTSPSYKRLSGGSGSRPSSVLGRSSAFSRRTMASDAEDEVVG